MTGPIEFNSGFEEALASLPNGYSSGVFCAQTWGVTVQRSEDGRRIWLFAEELGGNDMVSFNLYRCADGRPLLKPCEMSSDKVVEFVLGFRS